MEYNLKIELLSGTNPGSGEGWAGLIDSDVVFDDYGIPFIPARRIKGILRENAMDIVAALESSSSESAKNINEKLIKKLFGKQGQEHSAPLAIRNAYLEEYQDIREWFCWARKELPHLATPDRIISAFTSLKKQTAIDESGVQKDHSGHNLFLIFFK